MALNGTEITFKMIAEDKQKKIRLAELETFSNAMILWTNRIRFMSDCYTLNQFEV